jgi:hypothetical protein
MLLKTAQRLGVAGLLLSLFTAPARACNVPVFRYALERWPADPYEVVVIHRGPLAPDACAVVDALAELADAKPPRANLTLDLVDLDKQPARAVGLLFPDRPDDEPPLLLGNSPAASFAVALATLADTQLPLLAVRYPRGHRIDGPLWAGRLDGAAARALLDSPARREAARRILAGESAVWILLECGDRARDEAAARRLTAELARLEKVLELPELTDAPEDRLEAKGVELKLAFSALRVKRDDAAERFLVRSLLGLEPDLEGYAEPMAFAVFGRGRTLPALIGAGITPTNVEKHARTVTVACTCGGKVSRPGLDLLVLADWDALIQGRAVKDAPLPPLTGLSAGAPEPPEVGTAGTGGGPAAGEEACGTCDLWRNLLLALGGGLAVVALFAVVARKRS